MLRLRRRSAVIVASSFALIWLSLIFGHSFFGYDFKRSIKSFNSHWFSAPNPDPSGNSSQVPSDAVTRKGNATLLALTPPYLHAIMSPEDQSFARLECPAPDTSYRYKYLAEPAPKSLDKIGQKKYFFALSLYQCNRVLPRLMGSIVETIRFLGRQNCALSVVEGRSTDGTFEILSLLQQSLATAGIEYYFESSDINPNQDRIQALADLRNLALKPLRDNFDRFSHDATVIFLNDVAICMEDILELIHQRIFQEADMTCAMDWTYVGPDPTFYDVWIARGMTGDTFFSIPEDGNWDSAWNLFWNDEQSHASLHAGRPFQVFSCWNGGVAFAATPVAEGTVKFRTYTNDECLQGEPKLFCKDLWYHGYGRIAVVPSVNLEYNGDAAKKIKKLKGYVSRWVSGESESNVSRIAWQAKPPEFVKCMPTYTEQRFVRWDEGLPRKNVTASGQ